MPAFTDELKPGRDLEILVDAERIARRVRELGAEISDDYRGRPLRLVHGHRSLAEVGHTTIETTRSLDRHPFFPVEIDGRELSATLDTGAQHSVIAASRPEVFLPLPWRERAG